MKKILLFFIIITLAYTFIGEIQSSFRSGEETLTDYSEDVKESGFGVWSKLQKVFTGAVERAKNIGENTLQKVSDIKTKADNALEAYQKVKNEVNQKIEDLQNAQKQLLEAKEAIDKLMGEGESDERSKEESQELQALKEQLEQMIRESKESKGE